jgi:hypothetical protein
MDASNLLKPALSDGTLRCIGSTTYKEYRNYFEKDRALVRRFQKIDIDEPTPLVAGFICPACVTNVSCYGGSNGSATVQVTIKNGKTCRRKQHPNRQFCFYYQQS